MAHYSRIDMIVVDVPAGRHDDELAFWQGATGQELPNVAAFPEFSGARLRGDGIGLLVQRTGGDTAGFHIDVHTDDLEAEVARLEELGAERVAQHAKWWVMRDPAGLELCVVHDPDRRWDDAVAAHWP